MKIKVFIFFFSAFFFIFTEFSCSRNESKNENREGLLKETNEIRYKILQGNSPSRGEQNATLTIVVFSDFECPYCKKAAKEIEFIQRKNEGHIRVIFKNFPIDRHRNALLAAKAGIAAQNQNAFWQMHDILFEKSDEITLENILKWAESLKLDLEKFKNDLNSEETLNRLRKDKEEALKFGLKGTPYIFVNGIITSGRIEPTVKQELIRAEKLRSSGIKDIYTELMKNALNQYEKTVSGTNAPKISSDIFRIPVTGSLIYGNVDAPLTVIAFVDFEGKISKDFFETAEDINQLFKDNIRMYVTSYPLSYHKKGAEVSKIFYAAASLGKSREMYEIIFKEQENWINSDMPLKFLIDKAEQNGIDKEKLEAEINSSSTLKIIAKESDIAAKLNIRAAPSIFINGRFVPGAMPLETFKNIINEEIEGTKPFIGKGFKGDDLYNELMKVGKPSLAAPKRLSDADKPVKIDLHGEEACLGNEKAPVTIIEFSEFQCPYCKRAASILNSVMEKYKDNIRLCFKHRPLASHKKAKKAALYLIAVKLLYGDKKTFEIADTLFKNQNDWIKNSEDELFRKYAVQAGMDWNKIIKTSSSPKAAEILQKDTVEASKAGIRGVPVFFINGYKITGARHQSVFTGIIENLLNSKNISDQSTEKKNGKADIM